MIGDNFRLISQLLHALIMLSLGDIGSSSNWSQICVHHLKKIIYRNIYPLINQARYITIKF